MDRPSLTLLLASVTTASMDGDPRRLLAHLHPRAAALATEPEHDLATVSTLPRVIPMPRRRTESLTQVPDPDFDPTAA